MSELAADGNPVAVACRVLNIARQVYYRWLADPVTDAELEQAYRANALHVAHCDDPEFGYRYLHEEAAEAGEAMAARTAWRICHGQRLVERVRQEEVQETASGPARRCTMIWCVENFTAAEPNELWLTDITEHGQGRASSTSVPSRTCSPGASWGTPSTRG